MYKMIAVFALAALCLPGCGKKDEGGGGGSPTVKEEKGGTKEPDKTPASGGAVTLNGSGATFQKQFQEVAIEIQKPRLPVFVSPIPECRLTPIQSFDRFANLKTQ